MLLFLILIEQMFQEFAVQGIAEYAQESELLARLPV